MACQPSLVIFRPYRAVIIDEYYFVFYVQALKGRNIIGVGVALPKMS